MLNRYVRGAHRCGFFRDRRGIKKRIYTYDTFLLLYEGCHKEKYPSGSLAGLHLEGPWFSFAQGGAQKAEYFKNPVADELRQLKEKYPQ